MSNGMSKFTKGCLITALVTFIIGLLMCGVGALMGGFRMLDGMDIEGITEFRSDITAALTEVSSMDSAGMATGMISTGRNIRTGAA